MCGAGLADAAGAHTRCQSLKALNERDEIKRLFRNFIRNDKCDADALQTVQKRLRALRETLLKSPFFRQHEVALRFCPAPA